MLFQCASEDLKQRELAAATGQAVADLGNIEKRIHRSILCEVLERCMHLMYHNSKHPNLALEDTWDGMAEKFTQSILDMKISEFVLKRLKITQEDIDAKGWAPATWIDLVILMAVDDKDLASAAAPKAFEFHMRITSRASSHLALVAANIMRTSWVGE